MFSVPTYIDTFLPDKPYSLPIILIKGSKVSDLLGESYYRYL